MGTLCSCPIVRRQKRGFAEIIIFNIFHHQLLCMSSQIKEHAVVVLGYRRDSCIVSPQKSSHVGIPVA